MSCMILKRHSWEPEVEVILSVTVSFIMLITYTLCTKKRPPFYFSNNCQKLTDFNDFWCVKS